MNRLALPAKREPKRSSCKFLSGQNDEAKAYLAKEGNRDSVRSVTDMGEISAIGLKMSECQT